ncbi:hypothetical protein F4X33_10530 [Candidatus Poribacteria bacterium]|nr:hypothetical protein [Candidatus Poribacteria bacterium]
MNDIRKRIRDARRDVRGIALQTVVIMVVLLVIAGSVSAVLISRTSDVTEELQNQSIGGLTEETCRITLIGGTAGETLAMTGGGDYMSGDTACIWKSTVGAMSQSRCVVGSSGGKLDSGTIVAAGTFTAATDSGDDAQVTCHVKIES